MCRLWLFDGAERARVHGDGYISQSPMYVSMVMDLEQRLRLWAVGGMGVRECQATAASLNASTSMVMDCA